MINNVFYYTTEVCYLLNYRDNYIINNKTIRFKVVDIDMLTILVQ